MDALKKARPNTKFQFIGVHWPSAPLGSLAGPKPADQTVEGLQQLQSSLAETDPIAASKLQRMLNDVQAGKDGELIDPQDLNDLPENVRNGFMEMLEAMKPEDEAKIGFEDDESKYNEKLNASAALGSTKAAEKKGQEDDRPPAVIDGVVRFLFGGVERVLFGRFEERASTVGATGVHSLLSKLQKVASPTTRFHLVGHSLGCHVVCSALIGSPKTGNGLNRKVHSLMLLQGAVPHRCFAKKEMYRAISSVFQPVAGPIMVTTSQSDNALHLYRQFHFEPLGHLGAVEAIPLPTITQELQHRTFPYGFKKGHLYNFKADKYINETSGVLGIDLNGSHSDVKDPEVVHCLFEAWRLNIHDDDYRLPRLPHDYFTNVNKQREKDNEGGCIIS